MVERHIFIPVFQAAEFRDRLENEMRLIAQEGQNINDGIARAAIASIRAERILNWAADGMITPLPIQVNIPPEEIAARVKDLLPKGK